MSRLIDEHRQYVSDRARLDAFARAIAAVVTPGDVVVDLACGTGILGLLACRAGAGRVYAIESGSMLDIARRIARANGFADRITHVAGHSTRVTLPERADVIVCDQIGRLGFDAGAVDTVADARHRWLKPGGRVVPEAFQLHLAACEAPDLQADIAFWDSRPAGFDMSVVRPFAANSGRPTEFAADSLITDSAAFVSYDLTSDAPALARGEATLVARRAGTVHGLAGWFTARLAPGVSMTNAPGAADRIHRRNAFLPIGEPCVVRAGDTVQVAVAVRAADLLVNWRGRVAREARVLAAFAQSTAAGMLLTREDVAATREDAVPLLNPWARARQTVLELCDGRRTLRAIEAGTHARHADLFSSPDAAATFVAEVVTRYATMTGPAE